MSVELSGGCMGDKVRRGGKGLGLGAIEQRRPRILDLDDLVLDFVKY